jgi:hypothetical protein
VCSSYPVHERIECIDLGICVGRGRLHSPSDAFD